MKLVKLNEPGKGGIKKYGKVLYREITMLLLLIAQYFCEKALLLFLHFKFLRAWSSLWKVSGKRPSIPVQF